jgi:hypothetical protein
MDNNFDNPTPISTSKKVIIWILVLVAVALIGGGFYYSSKVKKADNSTVKEEVVSEDGSDLAMTINTKHQYKNGMHTLVGEMDMPTPCHLLESIATKDAVQPNKFAIAFTSTFKGEQCAQVVTPMRFKVSFEGPKDIELSATLDGKKVLFNLFEVKPEENIDTFEIYIKG